MKRIAFLSLFLVMASILSGAKTTITMQYYAGVYHIPCTVNGAEMNFIFDTGAYIVSLSRQMADYLLNNNYISASDICGTGTSTTADGRTVSHTTVNIRELGIGGHVLHNVKAVILDSQQAPLLLGQSAIRRLGRIELHKNQLIIHDSGQENGQNTSLCSDNNSQNLSDYYQKTAKQDAGLGYYGKAANNYKLALQEFCKKVHVDSYKVKDFVIEGKEIPAIQEESLNRIKELYCDFIINSYQADRIQYSDFISQIKTMAQSGIPEAVKYCNKRGIDY